MNALETLVTMGQVLERSVGVTVTYGLREVQFTGNAGELVEVSTEVATGVSWVDDIFEFMDDDDLEYDLEKLQKKGQYREVSGLLIKTIDGDSVFVCGIDRETGVELVRSAGSGRIDLLQYAGCTVKNPDFFECKAIMAVKFNSMNLELV